MHFGDPEYFAYIAGRCIERGKLKSASEPGSNRHCTIPTRASIPRTVDQRRSWIIECCKLNRKELPPGFETKNDKIN